MSKFVIKFRPRLGFYSVKNQGRVVARFISIEEASAFVASNTLQALSAPTESGPSEGVRLVLDSVGRNFFTVFNGGQPAEGYVFDRADFSVWLDCLDNTGKLSAPLPTGAALGGFIAQAERAGLVIVDKAQNLIELTADGFSLVRWS